MAVPINLLGIVHLIPHQTVMNRSSPLFIALPAIACSHPKVPAPDRDDTNLSKTGGDLQDKRIRRNYSVKTCGIFRRILVRSKTSSR